jgi:hypothetical protein
MLPKYDGGWVFERPSGDMDPFVQEPCMENDATHESHRSMVSPSALGDVDEVKILTNDNSDHLYAIGQRILALCDLEDRLLVTEGQITQVMTRNMELINSLRLLCGKLRWRRDTVGWQVQSLVLSCVSSTMH